MSIHMELTLTVSMIILVVIFLKSSAFRVVRFLSLMVRMHLSISGNFSSSEIFLSSIWSDVSPSHSGLNSLFPLQSVIQNPLWLYVLLVGFIADSMSSFLLFVMYSAVISFRLFLIVIMNTTLFINMISIDRVMFIYLSFPGWYFNPCRRSRCLYSSCCIDL